MKAYEGGPAFPSGEAGNGENRFGREAMWEGMTLRDYFAGQALGHLSQPLLKAIYDTGQIPRCGEVAGLCYEIADAMIEARQLTPLQITERSPAP
jgi:hypothetical protein